MSLYKLLFPDHISPAERRANEQKAIEESALVLSAHIAKCKRVRECYDAFEEVVHFKGVWGTGAMVSAWYNSLMVQLWVRQASLS